MGSSNHNLLQHVYVVNQPGTSGGPSANVNIVSSIPLEVEVTGIPGAPVANTYNEVTLVPSNTLTTVASYTVPAGKTFYCAGFTAGGDVNAWFKLFINGIAVLSARSTTAQQTVEASFLNANESALAGQTVQIKVTHYASGILAEFEGTILGVLG